MKHNIISKLSGFNKSVKVRLVILLHEYLSDGPGLLLTLHGQNNCNDILMIINYFRTMPNDELLQEIERCDGGGKTMTDETRGDDGGG